MARWPTKPTSNRNASFFPPARGALGAIVVIFNEAEKAYTCRTTDSRSENMALELMPVVQDICGSHEMQPVTAAPTKETLYSTVQYSIDALANTMLYTHCYGVIIWGQSLCVEIDSS